MYVWGALGRWARHAAPVLSAEPSVAVPPRDRTAAAFETESFGAGFPPLLPHFALFLALKSAGLTYAPLPWAHIPRLAALALASSRRNQSSWPPYTAPACSYTVATARGSTTRRAQRFQQGGSWRRARGGLVDGARTADLEKLCANVVASQAEPPALVDHADLGQRRGRTGGMTQQRTEWTMEWAKAAALALTTRP